MSDDFQLWTKLVLDSLERLTDKQESMSVLLTENNINLKNAMKTIDRLQERQDSLQDKMDEAAESHQEFKDSFKSHEDIDAKTLLEVIKLNNNLIAQGELLDRYNEQLEIHIKRTNLLEEKLVPILEKQKEEETVEAWKESKYKTMAKWAAGVTGAIAVVTAIIEFFFKIF